MPTSVTAFVGRCRRGESESTERPIEVSSWGEFVRRCGDVWAQSDLPTAVQQYFLAGGVRALIVRVVHAADTTVASFDLGGGLELQATSLGSWPNELVVRVEHPNPALGSVDPSTFHLSIGTGTGDDFVAAEVHRLVSVDPSSARNVQRVLRAKSSLLRATTDTAPRPAAIDYTTSSPGDDGSAPTNTEMEEALERLRLADVVNLICIPPYAASGGSPHPDVYTAAVAVAEELRSMVLVDPPDGWTSVADAASMSGVTSLAHRNVIMTYPAVRAPDPVQDGLERAYAPSAFMAGVISRSDGERGVWFSPAGMDAKLRGVTSLEQPLTEAEIGQLNQRGVNALVERGLAGPVVWGSRTAVGADTRASQWKYIAVRRLALYIEESLRRGLQWAVFEPNDAPLHAQIRMAVGGFMQQLFRDGAFAGSQVRDAYEVKCDAETTTPDDVARGIVNIIVRFAPLKPAEFVVLTFQQMAGQAGG
ncbi:MAG: phage tail sheath family protein [Nannocystaceae bacterium]|nr:phage tail sheath subtilisin-like domain-containing protein [bacterium]